MKTQNCLAPQNKLALPQVTLCAAATVNVLATIRALEFCLAQIDFAGCKLFTDIFVQPRHSCIEIIPIKHLDSSAAYSNFLLSQMVDHVASSHCLVAQWDGHVLDAKRWRPEFLDYDYIGASWPQFNDGHNVGNGGFSLRSRWLMEACRDPQFCGSHPEDVAIGRINRSWLEGRGMRFAPSTLADLFATERVSDLNISFGYHGVFNMPRAIGIEAFWQIYRELNDRSTIRHDFGRILKYVKDGKNGHLRTIQMTIDYLKHALSIKK